MTCARRAARDAQALRSVANEIAALGGRALAVPTDVGDASSVERLIRSTVNAYGGLDVAFHNAAGGGHRPTPLADVAVEDFDSAVRVTLRGVSLAMKYEIPAMLANGGGAIVNMSSTAGVSGVPGVSSYVASKPGVIGLTEAAALDYAQQNIRVNAIAPGPILTHHLAGSDDQAREQIAARVPMHRPGTPEGVAATVVWLCSSEASFITGATLVIDGGRLAGAA